jgi:peptide-methionine (R)-S-oxide reductase
VVKRDVTREADVASDKAKVERSEEVWKSILTPLQYHILREKGTERAFTGEYWNTKTAGTYVCAGCGTELFTSTQKYDSGCGWPSFFDEIPGGRIQIHVDRTHHMVREEIVCAACGGLMREAPCSTRRRSEA